jgi:hypothetical protein
LEYGFARVLFEKNKLNEAKMLLENALVRPTRRAEILPWVYFGLALVAKQSNDETKLRWAVEAAIVADQAAEGNTGAAETARALLPAPKTQK